MRKRRKKSRKKNQQINERKSKNSITTRITNRYLTSEQWLYKSDQKLWESNRKNITNSVFTAWMRVYNSRFQSTITVSIWRWNVFIFWKKRENASKNWIERHTEQNVCAFLISRTVGVLLISNAKSAQVYLLDVQPWKVEKNDGKTIESVEQKSQQISKSKREIAKETL